MELDDGWTNERPADRTTQSPQWLVNIVAGCIAGAMVALVLLGLIKVGRWALG